MESATCLSKTPIRAILAVVGAGTWRMSFQTRALTKLANWARLTYRGAFLSASFLEQ